jgi:hypothetical protein
MKTLFLNEEELNDLIAKVANEIDDYGTDSISDEIVCVFLKLLSLEPTWKSELVIKYEKYYKR